MNFVFKAGITNDLAKKSRDPLKTPRGGSPGGLRTISAGTTLLGHTVHKKLNMLEPNFEEADGLGINLFFKVPIKAHCNLPEATTRIGQEVEVTVEQCNGAACFEFPISYDVNMDQIRALIGRSTACSQLVEFSCFSTPLMVKHQLLKKYPVC